MRSASATLLLAVAALAVSAPALAHHSFEVEYDPNTIVQGTGIVTKVEWTNPHMRVYVDVTEPNGSVTSWNLELGAVNSVLRRGWKRDDLKAGEKIAFKGFGGRKVMTRAAADSITLPDGRSFSGASGAPNAPPIR